MDLIVVGVDGSDTAWNSGKAAARLAVATNARLHVVTAYVAKSNSLDFADMRIDPARDANRTAANAAAELREIVSDITSNAVFGHVAEALTNEAETLNADLIVVGNRRIQSATRPLGSAGAAVARRAPCDVYIVNTVG